MSNDWSSDGQAISAWADVTVTAAMSTNTTVTAKRRKVGDSWLYRVVLAFSGAPDSTGLYLVLPDAIDTTKLPNSAQRIQALGVANIYDVSAPANYTGMILMGTTSTRVFVFHSVPASNQGMVSEAAPMTIANGDFIGCDFTVPA